MKIYIGTFRSKGNVWHELPIQYVFDEMIAFKDLCMSLLVCNRKREGSEGRLNNQLYTFGKRTVITVKSIAEFVEEGKNVFFSRMYVCWNVIYVVFVCIKKHLRGIGKKIFFLEKRRLKPSRAFATCFLICVQVQNVSSLSRSRCRWTWDSWM